MSQQYYEESHFPGEETEVYRAGKWIVQGHAANLMEDGNSIFKPRQYS